MEKAMTTCVKILVVDDIEQNIVALEALVNRPGLQLLKAYSGAEALEMLLENDVALALIDVQMPGMDGFELAEFMRGSPRTRHVPIIFLTATDRNTHRTFRGYDAGAVDFLYKPFDPHILRSKIEVFVQLQQQKLKLAEQLESMTQLLRTHEMFVAILGHDLRNPLAAVVNTAEALLQISPEPRVQKAADRIRNSGGRMSRMVDQMLDIARMRSGRLELSRQPMDLKLSCMHIIDEFENPDQARRLVFEPIGDTQGHWDGDRLAQVLSNLIGNALQHGQAGTPVSVVLNGTQPGHVTLSIRNVGSIPPEVQANIFQPFNFTQFRRDGGSGLGLGLYIAKELVLRHQGDMTLDCSVENETVFRISLPRTAQPSLPVTPDTEKQWVY